MSAFFIVQTNHCRFSAPCSQGHVDNNCATICGVNLVSFQRSFRLVLLEHSMNSAYGVVHRAPFQHLERTGFQGKLKVRRHESHQPSVEHYLSSFQAVDCSIKWNLHCWPLFTCCHLRIGQRILISSGLSVRAVKLIFKLPHLPNAKSYFRNLARPSK